MSPLQMAMQIRHILGRVRWTAGDADLVFGSRSVAVFAGTPTEEQIPPGWPWALVQIETGTTDDVHPDIVVQTYAVQVGAEVAGDPLGEFSLVGGSTRDIGTSAGRGVEEVAERVRAALGDLTTFDGAQIRLSSSSSAGPTTLGRGRHCSFATIRVEAHCSATDSYTAPQELRHSSGLNRWDWQGLRCSARYDFIDFRMLRKTGSSPSSSVTDGTVVYTGANPYAILPKIGGETYTVFARYGARGTVTHTSDPIVGAYRS